MEWGGDDQGRVWRTWSGGAGRLIFRFCGCSVDPSPPTVKRLNKNKTLTVTVETDVRFLL
jgi:hypothetical protein